jgi:hypothetical protein
MPSRGVRHRLIAIFEVREAAPSRFIPVHRPPSGGNLGGNFRAA